MAFNINDIKSALKFGGARNSLFQVDVNFPVGIGSDAIRKLPYMARATELPPTEIGSIRVPYFGRDIKVVGDRKYNQWTISVINDEDFPVRQAMEEWAYIMNTVQGNFALPQGATPALYKRDGTVTQFSKTKQVLRVYQFSGLFPVNVGPIQMDWGMQDQIETFNVTFEYDYHETVAGVTGTIQG